MKQILAMFLSGAFAQAAVFMNPTVPAQFTFDDAKWTITWPSDKPQPKQEAVDKKMAENTLFALQLNQADDGYHTRVSLVTDTLEKFSGNPDEQLEKYKVHAIQFWKSQRFDVEKESKTATKALPNIAEKTHEMVGYQRDFKLKFWQYVFIHGGKAYILSAASRNNKFDDRRAEIKAIFDTVKLTQ